MDSANIMLARDIPHVTLSDMRANVLRGVLRAAVVLAFPQAVIGIREALYVNGLRSAAMVYVAVYMLLVLAAVWTRLGMRVRGGLLLTLMFAIAVSELYHYGLTTVTGVYFFGLVIFAGILFGLTVGWIAYFLSLVTLALAASIHVAGLWTIPGKIFLPTGDVPLNWLGTGIAYAVLAAVALVSLTVLLHSLDRSIHASRRLVQELKAEVAERERAKDALRTSERAHRELVENVNSVILRMDRQGRVTFINDYGQRFFGFPSDELVGKHVIGTIVPERDSSGRDLTTLIDTICAHPESCIASENENIRRDGERVWMAWTNRALYDATGQVREFLCVATDITARKRSEDALKERESRLRILFEQSADAIFVVALDGCIVQVNRQACRATGYSPQELQAMMVAELDHDYSIEAVWWEHEAALSRGYPAIVTSRHWRKDGTSFPVEVTVTVLDTPTGPHILAAARDITERMRGAEERERLILAIDQAEETVVITDVESYIQFVNPAFERITGYSRDEVLGQSIEIIRSGVHDDAFYEDLYATLARGETWKGRFVNRRKDGSHYTEDALISPVRDATGAIVSYVGVKRDVTDALRLEEQLRQAQKMEAIGQLTGGVAHDFNNLLQVIGGCNEMASELLDKEHPAHELLHDVAKATDRAARLVSQLLMFSRRQIMHQEILALNHVVEEMLKLLRRVLGEHIHIEWIPGTAVHNVRADRGMMEQAVMNLCVNARDAMPDGGRLVLETREVEVDAAFCASHQWAVPGTYTMLSVTDTGIGMDRGTLDRVFEPFFTTKEQGKGTGLGLATVYGIVKQHDGMITIYSEPGRGTCVKLYVPVCAQEIQPSSHSETIEPRGGSETILLAEDEDAVRGVAQRILEQAGYTVLAARHGVEALELYERDPSAIDMAILDVVMPTMGGRECYENIRERDGEFPVLFASGYSESSIHTNFALHDGLNLIEKPFTRDTLLIAVRDMLDRGEHGRVPACHAPEEVAVGPAT